MAKEKSKGFFQGVSFVLVLFLIFVFVCLVWFLTNDFKTGIGDFYLKCNEEIITENVDNFEINLNEEYDFEIVSNLDKITDKNNYTISVVPNVNDETSFTYMVGAYSYKYGCETVFTDSFDIQTYDNHFTFKATKELNEVLADYYAGQTITNSPTAVDSGLAYFSLVVATENYSINLNFSLKGV